MRKRIDDRVDTHFECHIRVFTRIESPSGMFPRVSEIGIEVNHHHKAASLVIDPTTICGIAVESLIGASTEKGTESGYLDKFINFKEASENGVGYGDVHGFSFRENLFKFGVKPPPFTLSVKIVNKNKPAA